MVMYLILSTEDVSVILLEPPDSGETGESAGQLVAMQDTEIGHPQRKLLPRSARIQMRNDFTVQLCSENEMYFIIYFYTSEIIITN